MALVSSGLLFLPSSALSKFGVDAFVAAYRMWIGFVCFASYAMLLTHSGFFLKDAVMRRQRQKRMRETGKEYLRHLTRAEKKVLAVYLLTQSKTRNLDVRSGLTNGVEQACVICRAASVGSVLGGFAYNLQPWAWEELNVDPELLEPEMSEVRRSSEPAWKKYY